MAYMDRIPLDISCSAIWTLLPVSGEYQPPLNRYNPPGHSNLFRQNWMEQQSRREALGEAQSKGWTLTCWIDRTARSSDGRPPLQDKAILPYHA